MKQSVTFTGPLEVMESLAKLRRLAPDALAGATWLATATVISTAMRLTPVDTGWLKSSRYVRLPKMNGGRFSIEAGFAATYAIHVHEIHKDYIVGEWKFLSTALNYHASSMLAEIARIAAGMLGAGQTLAQITGSPIHPTEPMDDTNRAALEGLASRYRRRKSKRTIAKRETSRQLNRERRARESASAIEAQRHGRRAPPPGRG